MSVRLHSAKMNGRFHSEFIRLLFLQDHRETDRFFAASFGMNGRFHSEFIRLLFLQAHRETDRFFAASGIQSA